MRGWTLVHAYGTPYVRVCVYIRMCRYNMRAVRACVCLYARVQVGRCKRSSNRDDGLGCTERYPERVGKRRSI